MSDAADLAKAQAEAAIAKARLLADAHALQARLRPNTLAHKAWESVRERGEEVADKATRFANARPVAASAAAVSVVVLLARRPLGRLLRRLGRRKAINPSPHVPARRARGDTR